MMFYSPFDLIAESANTITKNDDPNFSHIQLEISRYAEQERKNNELFMTILENAEVPVIIREGVISSIFEAIKNFFKGIINFFRDLFSSRSSSSSSSSKTTTDDVKKVADSVNRQVNTGTTVQNKLKQSPAVRSVQRIPNSEVKEIKNALEEKKRDPSVSIDEKIDQAIQKLSPQSRDILKSAFAEFDEVERRMNADAKLKKQFDDDKISYHVSKEDKLDIAINFDEWYKNMTAYRKITIKAPDNSVLDGEGDGVISLVLGALDIMIDEFMRMQTGLNDIVDKIRRGVITTQEDYIREVDSTHIHIDAKRCLLEKTDPSDIGNLFDLKNYGITEDIASTLKCYVNLLSGSGDYENIKLIEKTEDISESINDLTEIVSLFDSEEHNKETGYLHTCENKLKDTIRDIDNAEKTLNSVNGNSEFSNLFVSGYLTITAVFRKRFTQLVGMVSNIIKMVDIMPKVMKATLLDLRRYYNNFSMHGPTHPDYPKGPYNKVLGQTRVNESYDFYRSSRNKSNFKMYKPKFV